MGYLYKLISEDEIDRSNKGIISLSHPIFEFKGSEGKIINFAKRIYDKYLDKNLNVQPSEKDLAEIEEWVNIYKTTYGSKFRDEDINSESMILFCGIMQGFCGYFTKIDLSNSSNLSNFMEKSKLRDKKYILSLNDSVFIHHHWKTDNLDNAFLPFEEDPLNLSGYNGFTHPTDIVYSQHYDSYDELLQIYNGDELRNSHNWFNNLSKDFEWQKEKRIIFLLNSLEKNSSRIGCSSVYNYSHPISKYSEQVYQVYCNIVDAIDYCNKGPKYVYLDVGTENIKIYNINDILTKNDN